MSEAAPAFPTVTGKLMVTGRLPCSSTVCAGIAGAALSPVAETTQRTVLGIPAGNCSGSMLRVTGTSTTSPSAAAMGAAGSSITGLVTV